MLEQKEPLVVNYIVNDLVNNGYILTYIRTGLGLATRKIIIHGGLYRVEVKIERPDEYEVTYFVLDKTKNHVKKGKNPFIKLDDDEFSKLKCVLGDELPDFVRWAYDEDSFSYAYSQTQNKVIKIG